MSRVGTRPVENDQKTRQNSKAVYKTKLLTQLRRTADVVTAAARWRNYRRPVGVSQRSSVSAPIPEAPPTDEGYSPPQEKDLQRFLAIRTTYLTSIGLEEEFYEMLRVLLARTNLPYNPYPGFVARLRDKAEAFQAKFSSSQLTETKVQSAGFPFLFKTEGRHAVFGLESILKAIDPSHLHGYQWLLQDLTPSYFTLENLSEYSVALCSEKDRRALQMKKKKKRGPGIAKEQWSRDPICLVYVLLVFRRFGRIFIFEKMIAALRKLLAISGQKKPNANTSDDHGSCKGERQNLSTECVLDEISLKLTHWMQGVRPHMEDALTDMSAKLPPKAELPKLLNGLKFVLDDEGKPTVINKTDYAVSLLVIHKGKKRTLKMFYKDFADEMEVIYEASLMKYAEKSKVMCKVHGLAAVDGWGFRRSAIVTSYYPSTAGLSPCTWKRLCMDLCDGVLRLQKMGVYLINLSPDHLRVTPKKKIMIIDMHLSLYKTCKMGFLTPDIPAFLIRGKFPFMPPEISSDMNKRICKIHFNSDAYTLAAVFRSMDDKLGISTTVLDRDLEIFLREIPEERAPLFLLKSVIAHYGQPKNNYY